MDTVVDERTRRDATVRRAVGWGAAYRVISAVCSLLVVPPASRALPVHEFELWLVLWSLMTVTAPLDLGLGSALTARVASLNAAGRRLASATTLGTATAALVVIGGVVALVGTIGSIAFGAGALLGDGARSTSSTSALLVLVLLVGLNLPLSAAPKYLQGLHRSDDVAKVGIAANVVQVLVAVAAMAVGASLSWFVGVALLAMLLTNGACWLLVGLEQLRAAPGGVHRGELGSLTRSARWFWGLSIVAGLAIETDALVISNVRGVSAAAAFALPSRIFLFVPGVLMLAAAGFWPAVADARARGDHEWGLVAVRRMAVQYALAGAGAAIALAVVTPSVIAVVAQDSPSTGLGLVIALTAVAAVQSAGVPVAGYMSGAGLVRSQFFAAAAMAGVNLLLSIVGAHVLGLAGPPLATAASQSMMLVVSLTIIGREARRA